MLMPKKVKFRKQQRGRMRGKAWRGAEVEFGEYGLKALEPCWLTDRQIEAARVAMTRFVARGGKVWCRVFPDKPITKKPQETRMGKGKGAPEQWVCVVRPGKILFEMEGVSEKDAREAMKLAAAKVPIRTKFAVRFAHDKMQKSCVVAVQWQVRHGLYGKTERRTSKFMVHDEENAAKTGDTVEIIETRPQSRRKRWSLKRVVRKAVEV